MLGDPCESCGNPYPARRQYINDAGVWICDQCGAAGAQFFDVFWDGKPEINLADGPDGKPRVFLSRGEKARYLKERGLCEAGDKFHGAPFSTVVKEDRAAALHRNREEFRKARAKVESMGRDRRRQEVLRIIKEARQYEEKA